MSFMPNGSKPETASFTCNTCGTIFINAELQRKHMKTDWHRYNLKRKVANLPSISSEVFAEKFLQSKLNNTNENEDEYGFYIAKRKKKNNSNKNLRKHVLTNQNRGRNEFIKSKNVRSASPATSIASEFSQFSLGDDEVHYDETLDTGSELNYTESDFTDLDHSSDEGMQESDDESIEEVKAIPISHCFYCGKNNHEIETNVRHMYNHGLYIPERSFLIDLEGLLNYLSEMISIYNACLVCGFEGKNLESIRQHIKSKGHCKIPYETKDEKSDISRFYDFIEEEEKESTERKVGFLDEPESSALIIYNGVNDNYITCDLDDSGVQLILPTGSRIGHRSMQRYYRQNILLPQDKQDGQKTQALVDRRFSPGLTYNQISRHEKEVQKIENINKNIAVRKTKTKKTNYQKHYRDAILGT
ncbi:unnamed protein product [Candida verbasci]|uniref:C2H2-type domain-containing protein n=1 Tax=Candida verbasci TaxID=1227364 RepID=A0A9W4TR35_9ASCO|nr:unnamed protein product [Candida verbasci]